MNQEIKKTQVTMEEIISLCKRRGFIYPGSEIYGGLAGTYDYGPLGVALKNNIKKIWWKRFVDGREDMFGMDAAIIMNPAVWKASGHVGGFSDPMVECLECKKRFRVDQLIDEVKFKEQISILKNPNFRNAILDNPDRNFYYLQYIQHNREFSSIADIPLLSLEFFLRHSNDLEKYRGEAMQLYLSIYKIRCTECDSSQWSIPNQFNMMFQTYVGALQDESSISYLRPETAGGMFVNFRNIMDSMHPKIPFGMAQIGKAFRNEIAPRDFIFRVREFEQMEIEYFVSPKEWESIFELFRKEMHAFMQDIGLNKEAIHELEVSDEDRAFYSKRTIDIEYDFPFGKKELYGLAYRTDYDLTAHQNASTKDLTYFDEEKKERFIPHVIEPSFGVDRTVLAILSSAWTVDEMNGEKREYLAFTNDIAPYRACISPLLKNKQELKDKAREIFSMLKKEFGNITYDDNGNIGKRYRRQDEIGTPYCIVIDFDTVGLGENINPDFKDMVTIRNRNTGEQERVAIEKISEYLQK